MEAYNSYNYIYLIKTGIRNKMEKMSFYSGFVSIWAGCQSTIEFD